MFEAAKLWKQKKLDAVHSGGVGVALLNKNVNINADGTFASTLDDIQLVHYNDVDDAEDNNGNVDNNIEGLLSGAVAGEEEMSFKSKIGVKRKQLELQKEGLSCKN